MLHFELLAVIVLLIFVLSLVFGNALPNILPASLWERVAGFFNL